MATTFNWIYLGQGTVNQLDPTEGNTVAEGHASFINKVYGTTTDPLYTHIISTTMINNGGTAGVLDQNNSLSNDQFSTNIGTGLGTQTYTFDAALIYNATITYANGTTANVTAVLVQDTGGRLYLAPDKTSNPAPDTAAYEARPIVSIKLNSVLDGVTSHSGLDINRIVTGWDDGYIDGTSGNDLINASYIEPIANGTDRVDNGDGITSSSTGWQDDRIRAGAGNDTVYAGAGNDNVDGGTGADTIYGGDGNDTLYGGDGVFTDTIYGEAGIDTIDGGEGDDFLYGGAGNDNITGGKGNDYIEGGADNDTIDGGDGNDTILGGDGIDNIIGGIGNDTINGGNGNDTINGGSGNDIITVGVGDSATGGADMDTFILDFSQTSNTGSKTFTINGSTDGVDYDTLDLTGLGSFTYTKTLDADGDSWSGTATSSTGLIVNYSEIENLIVCFGAGTQIKVKDGTCAIELLSVGDKVVTRDNGMQKIRWIGKRTLNAENLASNPKLLPIRIKASALGNDIPVRDLIVSPQHRILVRSKIAVAMFAANEVFVAAKHLLGLDGVDIATDLEDVTYLHILCDNHEIIEADGAFAETLHTGTEAIKAMTPDAIEEITAIFGNRVFSNRQLARTAPKAHQARRLVERHLKNNRAMFS